MRWAKTLLCLLLVSRTATADRAREEEEFGAYGYKSMRAIFDQTCSCKEDGNCRLVVTRSELREQLKRYAKSIETVMPRLWPELTKVFAGMSTAEARQYGERLGQRYVQGLPRKDLLLWMRMLTTCWGTSNDKASDEGGPAVDDDTPHDGSLSKRGEVMDLRNGKLDEASGIAVLLSGCRKTADNNPNAGPFCGCFADYLRVSPPYVIRTLREGSATGDVSAVRALPGVQTCTDWIADGASGRNPFLKKGMKSSIDVEAAFTRCRTKMTKGKGPSGIAFCNRLVATAP